MKILKQNMRNTIEEEYYKNETSTSKDGILKRTDKTAHKILPCFPVKTKK